MKRLFHLIGIFVALFSVLFFFYLADKKDIITTTENEYTFQLFKIYYKYTPGKTSPKEWRNNSVKRVSKCQFGSYQNDNYLFESGKRF